MGSIVKVGNKYRAIVRVGEFRLMQINKTFPSKSLSKRFIQAKEIEKLILFISYLINNYLKLVSSKYWHQLYLDVLYQNIKIHHLEILNNF